VLNTTPRLSVWFGNPKATCVSHSAYWGIISWSGTTGRYPLGMPFDELLASRIRQQVGGDPTMSERKMFGGLCFMTSGNMCFGVVGDDLMVRVGPDHWKESLKMPFAREMDFTGRSMKGMVYVSSEGLGEEGTLRQWLETGLGYASSLPRKG
jgi:TfoX N-terminal domain